MALTIDSGVLAVVTGVVGALTGVITTLYARLIKDYDRAIERGIKLETELDRLQEEALSRALKAVEDQKVTAERWATISEFITRAETKRLPP